MKRFATYTGVAIALVLVGLSVVNVSAAGNTAGAIPATALFIDNQAHTIPAQSSLWFRFDYTRKGSQAMLTMVNGVSDNVGFNVYTPDQISSWWDTAPIGRGTMPNADSNDLTWVGQFDNTGTYYVEVVNNNTAASNFRMLITGDGIVLSQNAAAVATGGTNQPVAPSTTAPTTIMTTNDPSRAAVIDNQAHTLAANQTVWYRFHYTGDRSPITIHLPNGTNSGVEFNIFTPDQLVDWWDEHPVGRGTAQTLNCDTGEPEENGACSALDFSWIGSFNAAGTYYVQVVNTNLNAVRYQLTIQGDGVSLQ
jgi:hypothetical protein